MTNVNRSIGQSVIPSISHSGRIPRVSDADGEKGVCREHQKRLELTEPDLNSPPLGNMGKIPMPLPMVGTKTRGPRVVPKQVLYESLAKRFDRSRWTTPERLGRKSDAWTTRRTVKKTVRRRRWTMTRDDEELPSSQLVPRNRLSVFSSLDDDAGR